jgi:hypothetical protein
MFSVKSCPAKMTPMGAVGTASFFNFHFAGNCRVRWCGADSQGWVSLEAIDLGCCFTLSEAKWWHPPRLDDIRSRQSGTLHVIDCRAFALALAPELASAAARWHAMVMPEKVRRAAYGHLARSAARLMDAPAAVAETEVWLDGEMRDLCTATIAPRPVP